MFGNEAWEGILDVVRILPMRERRRRWLGHSSRKKVIRKGKQVRKILCDMLPEGERRFILSSYERKCISGHRTKWAYFRRRKG